MAERRRKVAKGAGGDQPRAIRQSLLILLLGQLVFLFSPAFGVREVHVSGLSRLEAREVIERTGIQTGDSIWLVSSQDVKDRLTSIALVERAQIRKRLPREVRVSLLERSPVAITFLQKRWWGVDHCGFILYPFDSYRPDLPVLLLDPSQIPESSRIGSPSALVLLRSLRKLSDTFSEPVLRYEVSSKGELSLFTEDRIWVRMGMGEDLAEKMAILPSLLAAARQRKTKVAYIDLRFKNAPVLRIGDETRQ
ncbi:MAG: FtsQ-type POTRA domain-containing protein [Armatimonadetes bacterium]|nr:FtsQ-type POTRA domain-containing protein [Armatimonadota bacterium]